MSELVIAEKQDIVNVADAIRSVSGTTDTMTLSEMADTVSNFSSTGASIDVTATVGQTIVVTEVDANGKPTKWEAADYQPRTHWSEDGKVPVLKFQNVKSAYDSSYGAFVTLLNPFCFDECVKVFPLASVDTIKYDGVDYANLATFEATGMRFFGNLYFLNSMFGTSFSNTGEPFVLGGNEAGMMLVTTDTEETQHTLQIYVNGTQYHRIEQGYLPQIPTIDLTPYYEYSDNPGYVTGDDYFEKVYAVLQRAEIVRVVYHYSTDRIAIGTGSVLHVNGMGNIRVFAGRLVLDATTVNVRISNG